MDSKRQSSRSNVILNEEIYSIEVNPAGERSRSVVPL